MTRFTLLTPLALTAVVACARDARPRSAQTPSQPTAHTAQQPSTPGTVAPSMAGPQGAQALTAFVDPGARPREPVREAIAVMYSSTGLRLGTVRFVDTGERALDVFTQVEGLPAGVHAYHVHVYGDCSTPDAKSAGPHFHFTGSSLDENVKIITGNLGELTADPEGRFVHRTRIPDAQLQGPFSILGRSVVIHAEGNDPAVTPDGGAGARIACGVIGVANPQPPGQPSAAR